MRPRIFSKCTLTIENHISRPNSNHDIDYSIYIYLTSKVTKCTLIIGRNKWDVKQAQAFAQWPKLTIYSHTIELINKCIQLSCLYWLPSYIYILGWIWDSLTICYTSTCYYRSLSANTSATDMIHLQDYKFICALRLANWRYYRGLQLVCGRSIAFCTCRHVISMADVFSRLTFTHTYYTYSCHTASLFCNLSIYHMHHIPSTILLKKKITKNKLIKRSILLLLPKYNWIIRPFSNTL